MNSWSNLKIDVTTIAVGFAVVAGELRNLDGRKIIILDLKKIVELNK